jgi:6-phosphogluconolactonase
MFTHGKLLLRGAITLMPNYQLQPDAIHHAEKVAHDTANCLNQAITELGGAIWVLAGGSAPMKAYGALVRDYGQTIDWSKVTVLLGDERCVPIDDPQSNWLQISKVFLSQVDIPEANQLRPEYEKSPEAAAETYNNLVEGLPRFDLVWLGMGADGHTLSLFPNDKDLTPPQLMVIPVHDSPKPPPDRISLTLTALRKTCRALVITASKGKETAIKGAMRSDLNLPVVQAAHVIEDAGGSVTWWIDATSK